MTVNPLLTPSTLPYQLPPFADIKTEHFAPAFDEAIKRHAAEITAIVDSAEEPTWRNTVEALEAAGQDLDRVVSVFANLSGTDADDEMDALGAEYWPKLSAHSDSIYQNTALYERIQAVTPPADEESQKLHEHILRQFVRKGAALSDAAKSRLSEINQRLSALSEEFGRNLLADTRERAVVFEDKAELEGLPEGRIEAAAAYAAEVGRDGYVIPLELPTNQSEQARLARPEARAALFEASNLRGSAVNAEGLVEAVQLRAERAELLGFETHADYVIAEETAGEAAAARKMLFDLAPAAATNAAGEYKLLAEEAGLHDQKMEPADWPYWESKVRERDFSLDEGELRKYFPLDRVLTDGVFEAAKRLYGITVVPRDDLQGYAEGVRVWEVFDGEPGSAAPGANELGEGIGLFVTDYFGRPSKRGGAWMSSFRNQSGLLESKPVIVNVMGITKPADGSTPLLSLDELRTVFHEFGHALHGLLSDVRYPTFSGTNVPRDWVEFPSQINENWALDPSLVKEYAFHVETGEPIPDELLAAIDEASTFGQGFGTVEYLAASIIDLAWHSLTSEEAAKLEATPEAIDAFEAAALAEAGLGERAPEGANGIKPRYRSTYFNHIFAGGYSAGYYSYLWAEVLDADGFEWFREQNAAGSSADPAAIRAAGQKFRENVLAVGASRDFTETYRAFRGKDKDVAPLLTRRGLSGAA